MNPTLDIVLIVKNEEERLAQCLESLAWIRPFTRRTVVYDTGSTDGTVAIAQANDAVVIRGFWDDNFAAARNRAAAASGADWVLSVDADEVSVGDGRALEKVLQGHSASLVDVDMIFVRNEHLAADGRLLEAFDVPKLYRPSRARYRGRVHEQVCSLVGPDHERSRRLEPATIVVRHRGYQSATALSEKSARNVRLARLELEDRRAAGDADQTLIMTLVDTGRSAYGAGCVEEAVTLLEEVRGMPVPEDGALASYRLWGLEQLAHIYIEQEEPRRALDLVADLRSDGASISFCDWLEARAFAADGRVGEAWMLLKGVDSLISSAGTQYGMDAVFEGRARAAIRVGQLTDALTAVVALMAKCGVVEGWGQILMRLSSHLSPRQLAQVLAFASWEHLDRLETELEVCGTKARQTADELRILHNHKGVDGGRIPSELLGGKPHRGIGSDDRPGVGGKELRR